MGLTTTGTLLCGQLMGTGVVVFSGQVRKGRFGVTVLRNLCCLPLCFCDKRQISWQWDRRQWGMSRAEAKVSLKTQPKWCVAACLNRQYYSKMPAQLLVLFPHSKKVLDSRPGWGRAFLCRFCMFCQHGFSPIQKTNLGYSKLSVGVNVSVTGCLSLYVSLSLPQHRPITARIGSSTLMILKSISSSVDGWMWIITEITE